MKLTRSGLIGLVFLAGCAVGGASSQMVAPASAHKAPKWEYRCFEFGDYSDEEAVEKTGNRLGPEGYEMAGAAEKIWCFKRPL